MISLCPVPSQRRQSLEHELDGVLEAGQLAACGRIGELHGLTFRGGLGLRTDQSGSQHFLQHHPGTRAGEARARCRGELRRRLEQARQNSRLGQRQCPRRFLEIASRCGLDAIGATTEIDAVEIELEDILLRAAAPRARLRAAAPRACARSCARATETDSWPVAGRASSRPARSVRPGDWRILRARGPQDRGHDDRRSVDPRSRPQHR